MRAGAVIASAGGGHHTPSGWFLVVLVVVVVLYLAMRSGRLKGVWRAAGESRLRWGLRGVRVKPIALVPTALLLVVIALLVFGHH